VNNHLSLYDGEQRRLHASSSRLARKSIAVWVSMLLVALPAMFVIPGLLPEHYTFDAQMIRDIVSGADRPTGFEVQASYANTALVYILLGVGDNIASGAWITYLAAWVSVLIALLLAKNGGRLWLWFPAFVWHALMFMYTCMHSKELHAMPALALLLLLCGRRYGALRIVALAAVVIGYAAYFRAYWAIAGMLALAFIVAKHHVRTRGRAMLAMAAAYLLMFVAYHFATGLYLTDARATLTAGRDIDVFSDTLFLNLFDNDNLLADIANALYGFTRLILPVSLLGSGKPEHLAFIAWQLVNVGVFYVAIRRVWWNPDLDARTEFAAAWIVAFLLTQGIFEPDYGTFLRHQTTLLPAFALLCINAFWRDDGSKRQPPAVARDMAPI